MKTPQGPILLVTNPLGTHRMGITQAGISNPYSSAHAVIAVTWRHSGVSPPLWLKRRECPWTERTFLTGLLMLSFLILKNFTWVLGNQPLWSLLPFWMRRLCSLGWCAAYSIQIYDTWIEIGGSESTASKTRGERDVASRWEHVEAPTCVAPVCVCERGQTQGQ